MVSFLSLRNTHMQKMASGKRQTSEPTTYILFMFELDVELQNH